MVDRLDGLDWIGLDRNFERKEGRSVQLKGKGREEGEDDDDEVDERRTRFLSRAEDREGRGREGFGGKRR